MAEIADVEAPSGGGGGGGLFSLSGTDWFGIGKNGQALAKGTERCGSRPNCIAWTKSCKKSRDAYNDCVMKTADQDYALGQQALGNDALKIGSDSNKNAPIMSQKTMIIIGVVVLIVIVFMLKKR